MKKFLAIALLILSTIPVLRAQDTRSAVADSIDNAVATFVANNFKLAIENAFDNLEQTGLSFNRDAVRRIILAELAKPYDSAATSRASMVIENAVEAMARAESQAMLDSAATITGATVTPEGVVVVPVTQGTGDKVNPADTVTMRYTGYLPDGHIFDAIGPTDAPMTAAISELTPGMGIALPLMNIGGTYDIYLPAAQAYGKDGIPGVIPADCALKFTIEILSTK